jgi:hypothetical protein
MYNRKKYAEKTKPLFGKINQNGFAGGRKPVNLA